MKKTCLFLTLIVATATAFAQYNTELLADPSFESSEGVWGNYYWNEDGTVDTFVSTDNSTNYYEAGTQVDDGIFSIKIAYGAGETPTWPEDGFNVNTNRNSNDDFTNNQGTSFTKVDIQNLSYNAGDTINASLRVYVDQWDANSNGVGFRVVGNNSTLATSAFTKTTGSWQTINLSHQFTSAFSGELEYELRYHYVNDGSGTASTAWVDSASMQVVPEPGSIALALLAFSAAGIGLIRRRR